MAYKRKKKLSVPGFVTYRKHRGETRGGVIALFLRKSIAIKEIPSIASLSQLVELCAIEVTNSTPSFEIIIFYRTDRSHTNARPMETDRRRCKYKQKMFTCRGLQCTPYKLEP